MPSRSRTIRENTRCEVEEPISTPTLRIQISSSPSRLRPMLEKKIRPPCSSVSIFTRQPLSADLVGWALRPHAHPHPTTVPQCPRWLTSPFYRVGKIADDIRTIHRPYQAILPTLRRVAPSNSLRQLALEVLVVELRLHAVDHALAREGLHVLLGDERVFHPVGDGCAAFGDVHGGIVGMDLAGRARLAARIVGAEPGGEAQGITGCAEMLVVPARAAGRRRDEADRLVGDALDEVRFSVAPRRDARMIGPRVGITLPLYSAELGPRGVGVGL